MASKAPNLLGPSSVAVNAGAGPHFDVLEVGHPDYVALINADTAFWVLSPREEALAYLLGGELPQTYPGQRGQTGRRPEQRALRTSPLRGLLQPHRAL